MAQSQPTIESTIAFIEHAFAGMHSKNNDGPLYKHSVAVMESLPDDAPLDVKLAALLHDVVEDTRNNLHPISREILEAKGYSKETLDIVDLLTKDHTDQAKDVPYITRIHTIIASDNYWAIKIKYADVTHNISKARHDGLHPHVSAKLHQKYALPHRMLRVAVHKHEMHLGLAPEATPGR